MLEMPFVTSDTLPTGQSLWRILQATVRQYARHGWTLTRPLLIPLLKVLLGCYACLTLNYLFTNSIAASPERLLWAGQYVPWVLLGMLLITVVTLGLFFLGCWELLVYLASLNRNATEAFCGQPIETKPAYNAVLKSNAATYQPLLLAYVLLPLLPVAISSVLSWGLFAASRSDDLLGTAVSLLGVLVVQLMGVFVGMAVAILLTFVFQLAAFRPLPRNPFLTCLNSVRIVLSRWPTVLGLHMVLALITTVLAPGLLCTLLRVLRLTWPLDQLHLWLLHLMLQGADPSGSQAGMLPGSIELYRYLTLHPLLISVQLSDVVFGMVITTLLLPLGTLAFARLYWDIQLRLFSESTLRKIE